MSKSDLDSRPMSTRKRDAIEAHLTIVFAALAVAHAIQSRTGLSIAKVVKQLRPLRFGDYQHQRRHADLPARNSRLRAKGPHRSRLQSWLLSKCPNSGQTTTTPSIMSRGFTWRMPSQAD
jgi:hypothetical protein